MYRPFEYCESCTTCMHHHLIAGMQIGQLVIRKYIFSEPKWHALLAVQYRLVRLQYLMFACARLARAHALHTLALHYYRSHNASNWPIFWCLPGLDAKLIPVFFSFFFLQMEHRIASIIYTRVHKHTHMPAHNIKTRLSCPYASTHMCVCI